MAERLRRMPEWPPGASMPNARGVVALRLDKRLAVRLDDDSPQITGFASMAIYSGQRYKGEFAVLETSGPYALGWITLDRSTNNHGMFSRPEDAIRSGDRASCPTR